MRDSLWDYYGYRAKQKSDRAEKAAEDAAAGIQEGGAPSFWTETLPAYQQVDLPFVDIPYDLAGGRVSSVFTGQTPTVRAIGGFVQGTVANIWGALDPKYKAEDYMDLVDEVAGASLQTIAPIFGDEIARPIDKYEIPQELLHDPMDEPVRQLLTRMQFASTKYQRQAMLNTFMNEKRNMDILHRSPWYSALAAGLISMPVDLSAIADVLLTRGALKGARWATNAQKYASYSALGVATAAVTAAPRELFLHSGQHLRDAATSTQAVVIEAVLSGVLSPGFEFLGDAWARRAARRAPVQMTDTGPKYPDAPEEVPLGRLPYTPGRRSDIAGAKAGDDSIMGGVFYEHLVEFHRVMNKSVEYDVLNDAEWLEFETFIRRRAEEHRNGTDILYKPTLHGINVFEPVPIRRYEPGIVSRSAAARARLRAGGADEFLSFLERERKIREERLGLIADQGDPLDFESVKRVFDIDEDAADESILSAIRNLIRDFDLDKLGARVVRGGDERSDPKRTYYSQTGFHGNKSLSQVFRDDEGWWSGEIAVTPKTIRKHLARGGLHGEVFEWSGLEAFLQLQGEAKVKPSDIRRWGTAWHFDHEVNVPKVKLTEPRLVDFPAEFTGEFKAKAKIAKPSGETVDVDFTFTYLTSTGDWQLKAATSDSAMSADGVIFDRDSALYKAIDSYISIVTQARLDMRHVDEGLDSSFAVVLLQHAFDRVSTQHGGFWDAVAGLDLEGSGSGTGYKTIEVRLRFESGNPLHDSVREKLGNPESGDLLGRVYWHEGKTRAGKKAFVVDGVEHSRDAFGARRSTAEKDVLRSGERYKEPPEVGGPDFVARRVIDGLLSKAALRGYHRSNTASEPYQHIVIMPPEVQVARLGGVAEFGSVSSWKIASVGELDTGLLLNLKENSNWSTTHGIPAKDIDRRHNDYDQRHWRIHGELNREFDGQYKDKDGEPIQAGGGIDIYFDSEGRVVSTQIIDAEGNKKAHPDHLGKQLEDVIGEGPADEVLRHAKSGDKHSRIVILSDEDRIAAVDSRVAASEAAHKTEVSRTLGEMRELQDRARGVKSIQFRQYLDFVRRMEESIDGFLFGKEGGDIGAFTGADLLHAQRYVYARISAQTGLRPEEILTLVRKTKTTREHWEGLSLRQLQGRRGARYIELRASKAPHAKRRVPIGDELYDLLHRWGKVLEHNENTHDPLDHRGSFILTQDPADSPLILPMDDLANPGMMLTDLGMEGTRGRPRLKASQRSPLIFVMEALGQKRAVGRSSGGRLPSVLRSFYADFSTQYRVLSGVYSEATAARATTEIMGHYPGTRAAIDYYTAGWRTHGSRAGLVHEDLQYLPKMDSAGQRLREDIEVGTSLASIGHEGRYHISDGLAGRIENQLEQAINDAKTVNGRLVAYRDRLVFAFSGATGNPEYTMALRNIEYASMVWSDLDLVSEIPTVTYTPAKQRKGQGFTTKKKTIPIPEQVRQDLLSMRSAQVELGFFRSNQPQEHSLVFKSRNRKGDVKVLTVKTANKIFKRVVRIAGVDEVEVKGIPTTLHPMRSIRATELFDRGSIGDVRDLVGHKGVENLKFYNMHSGTLPEVRAKLRSLKEELIEELGGTDLTLENALDLTVSRRGRYRNMTEGELITLRKDIKKLFDQSLWDSYQVKFRSPHAGPREGVKSLAAMTDEEAIDTIARDGYPGVGTGIMGPIDKGTVLTVAQVRKMRNQHYALNAKRNVEQMKLLVEESRRVADADAAWKDNYDDMILTKEEFQTKTSHHTIESPSGTTLKYGDDSRTFGRNRDALDRIFTEVDRTAAVDMTGGRKKIGVKGRGNKKDIEGQGWDTTYGPDILDIPFMRDGEGPLFSVRDGERRASYEAISAGDDIIRALSSPDPEDALHELLHLLENRILHKGVPLEMRHGITDEDIDILEAFMGDRATREGKERFTEGVLKFLKEDRSPDYIMYGIYKKILAWIKSIFRWGEVQKVGVMSPEVRRVFSKILRQDRAKTPWAAHILQKVKSMVPDTSRADAVIHANLQVNPEARLELRHLREQILAGGDPDDTRFWDLVLRGADMDVIELVSIRRGSVAGNLVRKAMILTPGSHLMASNNPIAQRIANVLSDTGVIPKDPAGRGISLERQKYLGEIDAHYVAQHYKDMAIANRKAGGVLSTDEFDRMIVSIWKYSSGDPDNIQIDPAFHVTIDGQHIKPFKADAMNEIDIENLKVAAKYFVKQQEVQDAIVIESGQWSRSALHQMRKDYMEFYGERPMARMFDREKIFAERDEIVLAVMKGWEEYYQKVVVGVGGNPGRETVLRERLEAHLSDMEENLKAFESGRNDLFENTRMRGWRKERFKKEIDRAAERLAKQDRVLEGLKPNREKVLSTWENWRKDPLDTGMLDAHPGAINLTDHEGKSLLGRKILISDKWLEPWLYSSAGKNSIDFNEYHGLRALGVARLGSSDAKSYLSLKNALEDETHQIEMRLADMLENNRLKPDEIQRALDDHQDALEKLRLNTEMIKILEDQNMVVDRTPGEIERTANDIRDWFAERQDTLDDYRDLERELRDKAAKGEKLSKDELEVYKAERKKYRDELESQAAKINGVAEKLGNRVGDAQSAYTKSGRGYSPSQGGGLGVAKVGRDSVIWARKRVTTEDSRHVIEDRIAYGARIRDESTHEGMKISRDTNSVGKLGVAIERNAEIRWGGRNNDGFRQEIKQDLAALNIMHASVYGTWGVDDHVGFNWIGKNLRNLAYSMSMGRIVLSSIPDIALSVAVNGYGPTLSAVGKVMSHRMRTDLPFIHTRAGQGDKFMFSDMIYAMEVTMAQVRMQRMYGITPAEHLGTTAGLEPKTMGQKISTGTGHLGQWTSSLSGITRWNGFWKQVNAEAAQSNVIRSGRKLLDGKKLSPEETQYLTRFNLSEGEVADMARLQQKFGSSERAAAGEFHFAGQLYWTELGDIPGDRARVLRSKLEGTMSRAADMSIITPNASNVPGWTTKTEVGRLVSQFKKFFLAGSVEVTLPLAQRMATGSPVAMANFATLLTMGGVVYMAQSFLRGEDPIPAIRNPQRYSKQDWWRNVGTLAVESLDRSGAIGILAEPLNFADRFGYGPGSIIAGEGLSRSRSRPGSQIFLGPVAGKIDESLAMAGELARIGLDGQPISARGAQRMRRLTPLGNLLPLVVAGDLVPSAVSAVSMGQAQDRQWAEGKESFMDRYFRSFRKAEHRVLDGIGVTVNYKGFQRRRPGIGLGG